MTALARRPIGFAALVLAAMAALLSGASAARAQACANEAVRIQQGSTYLPECRGFEMVSPASKNGQEVEVTEQYNHEVPFQAALEGPRVTYTFSGGIPESGSAGLYIQGYSTGSAPGSAWSTASLAPESAFGVLPGSGPRSGGEWVAFAPDLSCGLLRTRLPQAAHPGEGPIPAPKESPEEQPEELYLWDAATNTKTLVTNVATERPSAVTGNLSYEVDGVASGCSRVVYENAETGYNLPGAPQSSLYEWSPGGEPRVASVLPDGKYAATVQPTEPGNGHGGAHSNYNQVSADGKRVFFTAASDGGTPAEAIDSGAMQVYVREEGASTRILSGSATEVPVRDAGAVFEGATKDGSKVFFLANYGLTPRTSASEATIPCQRDAKNSKVSAGTGCDLYEYDLTTNTLTDLSADVATETHKADKTGADVRGVLGFSQDGSYVYFSAAGQLEGLGHSEEENVANHEANVFVDHEGHISYVATIEEEEAGGGVAGKARATAQVDAMANTAGFGMHYDQARVSPNGLYALFVTHKPLTGYDNVNAEAPHEVEPEFFEYRYSEGAGTIDCVSCKPSGAAPTMASGLFNPQGPYLYVYNGVLATTLLDDGRAYFQTSDPLVARAVRPAGPKGEANPILDVYQWRPLGTRGCVEPTEHAEGCVDVLDDGTSTFPTYLVGASLSGEDVYLTTHSQLALSDQDGSRDIYDVRVGGGTLAQASSPNCEATEAGCQTGSTSGTSSPHGSEAAVAGGNLVTPPSKGEVESFKEGVVRVTGHRTKGAKLTLVVAAPGAGRITVSGGGLRRGGKLATHAGSYTLQLALAGKGRAALERHRAVRVKVRVSFASAAGKASSVTLTVVFR